MAVELATGYVSLVPSAKGIGAKISRELSGEMGNAGDSASKAFGSRFSSGVAGVASKVAAGISLALGGAALAAGAWGLKTAAANEQAQVVITTRSFT